MSHTYPTSDANGNKTRSYGSDYITYTTTDHGLSYGDFQSAIYPNNIRVDSPWVIGLATKNTLDHAGNPGAEPGHSTTPSRLHLRDRFWSHRRNFRATSPTMC